MSTKELERWYSKFDNITDEHGICSRTESVFEFQDSFCGTYSSSCQDSPRSDARVWGGMEWGIRVRRSEEPNPTMGLKPITDLSLSLILMRPDALNKLSAKARIEYRLTLSHNWNQSKDIHSKIKSLDVHSIPRVPLSYAEDVVGGNWSHFLEHPDEYCDPDGNMLVTCLLHVDKKGSQHTSLKSYLGSVSAKEKVSQDFKKQTQQRELEDRHLVDLAKAEGNKLFQEGRYLSAVVKYSEALSTFRGRQMAELWSNRSAAYMKAEMFQEALEDAFKARGLKPDWAKVYFRIAVACLQIGNVKVAVDAVSMGLQLKPGDVELLCLKMKIQFNVSKLSPLGA